MKDLTRRAKEFLAEQDLAWPTLHENRALLAQAKVRLFEFDGFAIRAQLNLGRLSFTSRKPVPGECFLCDENRPPEQKLLDVGGGFRLMCNPYPILPEHFTIVHERHSPQRIADCVESLLDLAVDIGPEYSTFYNGPQCGASAPIHLHIQAGPTAHFPATAECPRLGKVIKETAHSRILASDQYLRRFILLESGTRQAMLNNFWSLYEAQKALQPAAIEPMMNVLCTHEDGRWRMIIFPRSKHRSSHYTLPDERRLALSPGAMDVSGILVVPEEAHFNRITREEVVEVYEEITLAAPEFASLLHHISGSTLSTSS